MADFWSVALQILLVLVLYAFLFQVARAIYHGLQTELRHSATDPRPAPAPTPAAGDAIRRRIETFSTSPKVSTLGVLLVVESASAQPPVGTEFSVLHPTRIGRAADSAVRLPDNAISGQHADIEVRNRQLMLVDLGSTNGTKLNGAWVAGPSPLRDGDTIELGGYRLIFRANTNSVAEAASGLGARLLRR